MSIAAISTETLLIVVVVLVLLFGASSLPKLARSLGSAKSEFEKGIKEGGDKAKAADAAPSDAAATETTPDTKN